MLGRVFALSTAEEQAELLNEAGRTLRSLCKVIESSDEMQYCRMADHLDADGKRFVRELAAFVKLLDERPTT
jgi:primosomal protein N''